MIDNLDMYVTEDNVKSFSTLFIGANSNNTQSFIYPNIDTLYSKEPDVPFDTRIWVENPECLIHHGKMWFSTEPDSTKNIVAMPYKFMGKQLYKICCSIDTLQHAYVNEVFGNVAIKVYDIKGSAIKDGKVCSMKDAISLNVDSLGNVVSFSVNDDFSFPDGVVNTYCEIQFWYVN